MTVVVLYDKHATHCCLIELILWTYWSSRYHTPSRSVNDIPCFMTPAEENSTTPCTMARITLHSWPCDTAASCREPRRQFSRRGVPTKQSPRLWGSQASLGDWTLGNGRAVVGLHRVQHQMLGSEPLSGHGGSGGFRAGLETVTTCDSRYSYVDCMITDRTAAVY